MKSKTLFSWLVNPFTHIAGAKALCIGLCIQLITVFLGNMSGIHFDGAINLHIGGKIAFWEDLLLWGISVGSLILVLYAGGLIMTKKFRLIDMIGTILMARTPLLIAVVAAFFIEPPSLDMTSLDMASLDKIIAESIAVLMDPIFIIFTIFSLILMIWHIALLYNAYKVSVGLSVKEATIGIIIGIISAMIFSSILIMWLM